MTVYNVSTAYHAINPINGRPATMSITVHCNGAADRDTYIEWIKAQGVDPATITSEPYEGHNIGDAIKDLTDHFKRYPVATKEQLAPFSEPDGEPEPQVDGLLAPLPEPANDTPLGNEDDETQPAPPSA